MYIFNKNTSQYLSPPNAFSYRRWDNISNTSAHQFYIDIDFNFSIYAPLLSRTVIATPV